MSEELATAANKFPISAGSLPSFVAYSPLASGNLFVAASNANSNNISVYSIDQTTGILTQVAGSPFAAGLQPDGVAFSPVVLGNLFVAAANRNANTVSVYSANQTTGSLTPVTGSPFAADSGPFAITFSPVASGNLFAAAANGDGSTISVYKVNQTTGVFTQVSGSPFASGTNPFAIAFSPIVGANLFLAVANYSSNNVSVYTINQTTGALTPVTGSPFAAGSLPLGITFSPVVSGNLFAAVTNSASGTVSVYSVNQTTGLFTQVPGSPFSTGTAPQGVTFSLDGLGNLFAAVTNFNDNTVSIYSVNQTTGAFTQVSGSPFSTGLEPISVAFSPVVSTHLFAAIANASSGTVSSYKVDQATGALTSADSAPYPTGQTPQGIAFSPVASGNIFTAIANTDNNNVSVYKFNQTTDVFTQVGGSPFATQSFPLAVAFSPVSTSGNLFAATTNFQSNNVSVYEVDQSTGQFNPVSGSPFVTGTEPRGIAFSPTVLGNMFVAVTNYSDANVSVYSVNQITGVLTQVPGSPFATGAVPSAVAFSQVISGNLFAAISNYNGVSVSIYKVDQTTGAFTQVPGSPFHVSSRPLGVAFSPEISGNVYVAATNSESNNASIFSMNTTTGALTEVSGSPFSVQAFPFIVAFSPVAIGNLLRAPGSLFAAIANEFSNSISVFQISFADADPLSSPLLAPPSSIAGCKTKNVFLTQTDLINVITWTAPSTGLSPTSYYIYRDAALSDLATIVSASSPLVFADHNRKQGVVYSYYIVSSDGNNNFSVPTSITVTRKCQ